MVLQIHEGPIFPVLARKLIVGRRGLFRRRDRVLVRLEGFFFRRDGGFARRIDRRHGRIFGDKRRRRWFGRLHDGQLRGCASSIAISPADCRRRPPAKGRSSRCTTMEASTAHQTLRRSRFGSIMAVPSREVAPVNESAGGRRASLFRREIISPRPGDNRRGVVLRA